MGDVVVMATLRQHTISRHTPPFWPSDVTESMETDGGHGGTQSDTYQGFQRHGGHGCFGLEVGVGVGGQISGSKTVSSSPHAES